MARGQKGGAHMWGAGQDHKDINVGKHQQRTTLEALLRNKW